MLDKSFTAGYNRKRQKTGRKVMPMDKLAFMRLWDLYGKLLTPTQQEITDMYFNLDLTVSEIADEKGISRQGVSDCLSICKRELEGYEKKLRHARLADANREVKLWAEEFLQKHPEYEAEIEELTAILDKDYLK